MSQYHVRNIPPDVDAAITRMHPAQPVRGRTAQREGWLRTLICLAALGPERASPALDLWQSALTIARRRRGEEELRPVESVRGKFMQEVAEFDDALQVYRQGSLPLLSLVNRLANILYYSVQEYVQDYDIRALETTAAIFCERTGIPEPVAWRVAAAKFLARAARDEKESAAEEQAMQCVLTSFEEIFQIP